MSNVFQNAQNHGFWNFDFWFLSKGKKANVNYCLYKMQAHHNENMKELVYPPTNILCVASELVCNITTKQFLGWGKNGELLNWNLQTTS